MNTINPSRRRFMQFMSSAATLTPMMAVAPSLFAKALTQHSPQRNKILLMVELKGGNDALNMLVPYEDQAYYTLRPKLGIKADKLLKLGNGFGVNPAMKPLLAEWQAGDMAWVQGVGYANPNRSHFRSIEIWETASQPDQYIDNGWIAQLYAKPQQQTHPLQGIIVGSDAGPLSGDAFNTIQMQDKQSLISLSKRLKRIQSDTHNSALSYLMHVQNNAQKNAQQLIQRLEKGRHTAVDFPKYPFGRQLETTAQLILSGLNVPIYKVELGSFDTHQGQAKKQKKLLTQLSQGLYAFSTAMKKAGRWDDVIIMTYSEFGRRASENNSGGTDHGTAAAHFVLGGRIKGGIHQGMLGKTPSLTDLDNNDLRFTTDFRRYYNTLATDWLGMDNSALKAYGKLPMIET